MNERDASEFLHSGVFREYEKRIEDHFKATDARATSDRQAWEREFKALADALKLQAQEYERRLTVLNHAHEAAVQAQAMTVPRETFNVFLKDYEGFKKDFEKFKLETSNNLTVIATRSLTWTAAVGLFILVISVTLQVVLRYTR